MFSIFEKNRLPHQPEPKNKSASLDCIPVRNPDLDEQENDYGELRLSYSVRVKPWFRGIFKKVAGRQSDIIERKLQLDVLGTSVWRLIDGHRSVNNIIQAFQAEHKLNRREAEISISAFLKELGKRGLLAMREKKP